MYELADAVVVGGGILGVAVTAALSHRLSKVQLIESGRCGTRATAGGFAWVNASSKLEDEAYHRLNAEGCQRHLALAAERGQERTGWYSGGSLYWKSASDLDSVSELDHKFNTLQGWNYPVARLSRGEMQALEPNIQFEPDAVGLFAPSEGWVNTSLLTRFFLEEARENHAEVAEFTQATGLTRGHLGGVAGVETTNGRVSTRIVVICAGVETNPFITGILADAGTVGQDRFTPSMPTTSQGDARRLPLETPWVASSPGILIETAPLARHALVHRVCFPPDLYGLHLRPTADGGLLLGADDTDASTGGASHGSDISDGPAVRSLLDRTSRALPGLPASVQASSRRCVRPMPADGLPIAGALPGYQGVYLLVTHSGITLGPLLAQLLADEIITGRISPWLERYRPDRFLM